MTERYEVVKTLIIGNQSVKTSVDKKGNVRVTHHKKAVGYVLKDLTTGELIAVSHLEAAELAVKYGMTNANVVVHTTQNADGTLNRSPYIKAAAGCTPLQDPYYVVSPDRYFADNKNVKVSPQLAQDLMRSKTSRGSGSKSVPKYSREELMRIIAEKKAQLNR